MADGIVRTEIEEDRTAYSKVFDVGNNEIEQEINSYPIHYLDENNKMQDIDINIKKMDKWEFSYGVTSNLYKVYFGDSTNDENNHLVSIEFTENNKDLWTNFKLQGSEYSDYQVDKNRFIFKNCFENVDVEYIVDNEKLKENIILKEKTDLRTFVFTIKNGNVFWRVNELGELEVCKTENSEIIWKLDKPYMIDSDNNISYNVNYKIEEEKLFVSIEDDEFIENAKYPVFVDPTLTVNMMDDRSQNVILATKLNEATSTPPSTWSYNTNPSVGTVNFGDGSHLSALYFTDIDPIKQSMSNIIILKATLSLYAYSLPYSNGEGFTISNVTSPMKINEIPTSTNDAFFANTSKTINTWLDIDFKSQLVSKGANFNGFYFAPSRAYTGMLFRSPFYSDVTYRPKLIIRYIKKPILAFHDGTNSDTMYYSDGINELFKYIDFGTLIAGQSSPSKQVFIRNLSNFSVKDLQITSQNKNISSGVVMEISETNSPFVPTDKITKSGEIVANQDISFYVRVTTNDSSESGGISRILANAYPL